MENQTQPSNQKSLEDAQDEPNQIDAIAVKRRWFRGDPDGVMYPTVKDYMSGSLDLDSAVEKLAKPVEQQFSTADNGRAIRRAEEVAASQRQYHSPEEADKIWGTPLPEDELPPVEPSSNDTPTTEGHLWDLWYSVLHCARRTPWRDSASQNRLLDLVRALGARPDPPLPTQMTIPLKQDWMWSSGKLWSKLLMLGPSTRECWNDCPRGESDTSPPEIHAWTNINAFVAAITKEGLSNFWLYAIWAMRSGLEESPKARSSVGDHDLHVPAAAVWIMVAGEEIRKRDDVWEASRTGGDPACGGDLWKGKRGFCTERWDFWKSRFNTLRQQEGLWAETREIAAEAFRKMESLDNATAE
ncbi:hypothetical protein FQN54_006958 [Arachnomyces sp. PD_36]|nr:hypothetical protein FQN54_006958 [Arachnomyces sp. PD_36]